MALVWLRFCGVLGGVVSGRSATSAPTPLAELARLTVRIPVAPAALSGPSETSSVTRDPGAPPLVIVTRCVIPAGGPSVPMSLIANAPTSMSFAVVVVNDGAVSVVPLTVVWPLLPSTGVAGLTPE